MKERIQTVKRGTHYYHCKECDIVVYHPNIWIVTWWMVPGTYRGD